MYHENSIKGLKIDSWERNIAMVHIQILTETQILGSWALHILTFGNGISKWDPSNKQSALLTMGPIDTDLEVGSKDADYCQAKYHNSSFSRQLTLKNR